jgi:hypothetical protein
MLTKGNTSDFFGKLGALVHPTTPAETMTLDGLEHYNVL